VLLELHRRIDFVLTQSNIRKMRKKKEQGNVPIAGAGALVAAVAGLVAPGL
jgi:hypothetical protein